MKTFDYVIVGAGSAGSTLASRLSEDGKHSVIVLREVRNVKYGSFMEPGKQMQITLTYPCSLSIYGKNLVPGCTLTAQVSELEQ